MRTILACDQEQYTPSIFFREDLIIINKSCFWIQHFRKIMRTISACDQEQYRLVLAQNLCLNYYL